MRTKASAPSFPLVAAAVFTVMVAVTYLPVFAGKIPFPRDLVLRHVAWDGLPTTGGPQRVAEIGDLVTSFYPFHTLAARAAREGTIALWNPYVLGGAPFQANSQSALFYPSNFLYYILPVEVAWTAALAIRMFLAAVFMSLFVRVVGASTTGSIISGIIFASCGFMTAWQGQAMGDAAIWLPMICYAVYRLHQDQSLSSIALAGFCFAMPVLAGHPETAAHATITGSALALMLWIAPAPLPPGEGGPKGRERGRAFEMRFIFYFALAGVLALGLASIQMIPTLEWLGQLGPPFDAPWPALSRHDGQGFFSRDILSNPNSAIIPIPEAAAYVGMIALLFAPFALFHRQRRFVLFFATIALAAIAVAFSVEPVRSLVVRIPVIKALKNGRLILVASFGIAALAGFGISVLQEKAHLLSSRRRKIAPALLGATCLVAAFGIFEVYRATQVPVAVTRGPAASLVFLAAGALLLLWQMRRVSSGRLFPVLICSLAAVELVSFSYGYTGFTPPAEVFPPAPVFDFLRSQGDPATFRVAKAGYPIPANSGMMYGLETADGYDVCIERASLFTAGLAEERDDAIFFQADKIAEATDRRIDMLNVKYVTTIVPSPEYDVLARQSGRFPVVYKEGAIAVFENKAVLPRAFSVPQSGIEILASTSDQLRRIKDPAFDPQRMVVFSREPSGIAAGNSNNLEPFKSDVRLEEAGVNAYTFRTNTSSPSVLVLSQMYYPGWKASVDGNGVDVEVLNYALTGILLPAGPHEVRFVFRPDSFIAGATVSAVSLLVVAALVIAGRRRRVRA